MDSSSENSFAWTDTSGDSTDSSSTDENMNESVSLDLENDNKPSKKKKSKSSKYETSNGTVEEHDTNLKVKIEENESEQRNLKKKRIKLESECDADVPEKKRKIKHNEVENDTEESPSYDESYLDLKVKLEDILAPVSSKSKKKKKKSKKRINSERQDETVDTKPNIEEIKSPKSDINGHTKISHTENNSFQDESCSDEISAIQCDGDDIVHSISFSDGQSTEKTSKKSDNLHKSTVVNQFKIANNNLDHDDHLMQTAEKRTPRISDRITFEDSDDPEAELNHTEQIENRTSTKLRKYIKTQSKLKLIPQQLPNGAILTPDDEVWIVKCPKETDIQAFSGIDFNVHGKCKIKVGGQTYEGNLDDEQSGTMTALSIESNKFLIKNISLCGIINLRKRIPKPHIRDENIMVNNQTNFIPLPETKCRHPLFGSNYKKALKIPAAVAERLNNNNSNDDSIIIEKKRKKKHKKESIVEHEETDSKDLVLKCESHSGPEMSEKKKKKRKIHDDEGPAPKKVKKVKHNPESAEAWESAKAIEENLFDF